MSTILYSLLLKKFDTNDPFENSPTSSRAMRFFLILRNIIKHLEMIKKLCYFSLKAVRGSESVAERPVLTVDSSVRAITE